MEIFEQLFHHNQECQVLVCKRCRIAIPPSHIKGHIREHHRKVVQGQQDEIIAFISKLSQIAHSPDAVIPPNASSSAVEGIAVHHDGYRCIHMVQGRECNYTCRQRRCMTRHCQEQHRWRSSRKRGQTKASPDEVPMWVEKQACQMLFRAAGWQKVFPIEVVPSSTPAPAARTIQQAHQWMDNIFTKMDEAKAKERVRSERSRFEPNPWLEHTGWERHLGSTRRWVAEFVQMEPDVERVRTALGSDIEWFPPDRERALVRACDGTIVLIRRSFQVSRPEMVGRHALHYVNRRDNGAPSNDRPFYGKQQIKTIRKYADVFVRILRYIWRTADMTDRPPYRLTREQQDALTALRQATCGRIASQDEREGIIRASLQWWIAVFDHPLHDDEYENAMLSGLAVLGACGERGGWVPAISYTPTLAAVITSMRAIVVRRAWRARQDHIEQQTRQGVDAAAAARHAPVIHQLVQQDVDRFMTMTAHGGQPHPMQTIYTQKMYGLKIRYSTHGAGQVGWCGPHHDVIVVRKVQFSMDQIRQVVHGLLATTRQRLVEELMCMVPGNGDWHAEDMPRFAMANIVDNPSVMDEGFNFIQDGRNAWPVDGKRWMGERLFTQPHVRAQFIIAGTDQELDPDRVEAYLRRVARWKEEMLVLVHMSAGAPARATELVSIQHENSPHARGQRGIMIDQGMMAFITSYHKGFSASQSQKHVYRFVPQEVGEQVVYYMWLIEPFVRILQSSYAQATFSPWMWEPAAEEEWGDEEEAWMEEEDDGHAPESPPEPVDNSVEAQLVRQQSARPIQRNCDGFWETNRIRRVMRRETAKRIGVPIGTSDWRQAYPAIHRQFAINRDVVGTLDRVYANANPFHHGADEAPETTRETMRAQQSGHSPQMEESIYGRLLQQDPFATMAAQDAFREVSIDWHRFMQFPSAFAVQHVSPDVQRRVQQEHEQRRYERWQRMRAIDVQAQLEKMYGVGARFRGKQREALEAIVDGQPRIVVVMRTGGGKSLLFMLPAAASVDGVTIVVMPKIMLQEDMAQRCRQEGIRCAIWSDDHTPPYDAQIVFVIAESAVSQSFADFVNAKMLNQQLERVVVDECHTVMQSSAQFRAKVLRLRELIGRKVQVVCLTATLPPRREPTLMAIMDIEPKETCIIRESTVRANIRYNVVTYDGTVETLRQVIQARMDQYARDDRIVVYCRTIRQMQAYAQAIGGIVFHSGVGDITKKRKIMAMLSQGDERLFWSTSALGEGIDVRTIRVVIHVGGIDALDDFAQQSGRAGRDGQTASESIVLQEERRTPRGEVYIARTGKETPAMIAYLAGQRCRRAVLDQEMDGDRTRTGCRADEQWCDVCRGEQGTRVQASDPIGARPAKRSRLDDITPEGIRAAAQQRASQIAQQRVCEAAVTSQATERMQREHAATIAAQAQWRQEQWREEVAQQQRQQRVVEQGKIVERLTALFERWKVGCHGCRMHGRPVGRVGWRRCGCLSAAQVAEMESRCYGLQQIRWEAAWTACQGCWAPQAICHGWEGVHEHGPTTYRKRPAGKCQYRGVLMTAVAVIMMHMGPAVMAWISGEIERMGGEMEVHEWLGATIRRDGVEMSGMVWLFDQWADRAIEGKEDTGGDSGES